MLKWPEAARTPTFERSHETALEAVGVQKQTPTDVKRLAGVISHTGGYGGLLPLKRFYSSQEFNNGKPELFPMRCEWHRSVAAISA